ncbi:MAG: gluconokinase [Actinomycetota bacterium]|nr:gluconokinase [Actinomycetota bacterium]
MGEGAAVVIGLDLGTSRCKAVALSGAGRVIARTARPHRAGLSQRGEQDPEKVWDGARQSLRKLAAELGQGEPAAAISLSGAMHTLLPVEEDGTPLAGAMTWADVRAAAEAGVGNGAARYRRTGCPPQPIYHPARLRWWARQAPEVMRRADRFVALKDWVLHRLAGSWVTDLGLASTTGLLDIHRLVWDEESLEVSGITSERLPGLVDATAHVGGLTARGADELGLPPGLPVLAGSSDGGLANLGAGAVGAGQVVLSLGTSGAVRKVVDDPWLDDHQRTWCYALSPGHWFAGGAINNGGLAVQWVRETLYPGPVPDAAYRRLLVEAAEVPAGAEGLVVLPEFVPERGREGRGEGASLHRLDLRHRRRHVARAALESIAMSLAEIADVLGLAEQQPVRLTGAFSQASVWSQVLSDVLGRPVVALRDGDASAQGAAIMGHRALGNLSSLDQAAELVQVREPVHPHPGRHQRYRELRHQVAELRARLDPG